MRFSDLFTMFRNKDPRNTSGKSFLALAASQGDLSTVRHLLDRGVDPNTPNDRYPSGSYSNTTALYWAGLLGDIELAEILLSHGADINRGESDKSGPLIVAIRHEHFNMVRFLIEKGADVNQIDRSGGVPLHDAALKPDIMYLKLLLDNGALPNRVDNFGDTPLSYATQKGFHAHVSMLKKHGADESLSQKAKIVLMNRAKMKQ